MKFHWSSLISSIVALDVLFLCGFCGIETEVSKQWVNPKEKNLIQNLICRLFPLRCFLAHLAGIPSLPRGWTNLNVFSRFISMFFPLWLLLAFVRWLWLSIHSAFFLFHPKLLTAALPPAVKPGRLFHCVSLHSGSSKLFLRSLRTKFVCTSLYKHGSRHQNGYDWNCAGASEKWPRRRRPRKHALSCSLSHAAVSHLCRCKLFFLLKQSLFRPPCWLYHHLCSHIYM